MPRIRHILTAGILLTLLAGAAWGQTGLLRASVVDKDGKPISGVLVTVTTEQQESYRKTFTTDKRGSFKLRFQQNQLQNVYQILFEKAGYQSFTVPLSPSSMQQMREEWEMERGETQVVESHGDLGAVVTGSSNAAVNAFNAGVTAQREGDLAAARAQYEAALAEDPSLGPAQMALAQVLLDAGDYAPAVDAADKALELSVSPASALRGEVSGAAGPGPGRRGRGGLRRVGESRGRRGFGTTSLQRRRRRFSGGRQGHRAGQVPAGSRARPGAYRRPPRDRHPGNSARAITMPRPLPRKRRWKWGRTTSVP